jgi:hypothetical protein
MTFGERLPGGLEWAYPTSRLINCTFGKNFIPYMACFYRLVAVMWMYVAELVVDGRTTGE